MPDLTYAIEVALGGTLTDLSSVVRGFSARGGRQKQFDAFQTGTATFTVIDTTGDYIPGGDGVWSGETWIGREVRLSVTAGDITNVVWRGHVEDIDVDFVDLNHSLITVTAVEPLALLGRTIIDAGTSFSSELSSVRVENVLALAEVDGGYFDSSTKDISVGETTLQAETDAGGNTLEYLRRVTTSEGGRLFVRHGGDPGGVLAFRPRTGNSSDVGVTFQDEDTGTQGAFVDGGTAATSSFSATHWDGGDAFFDRQVTSGVQSFRLGGSVGTEFTVDQAGDGSLDGGDASSRYLLRLNTVDIGFGSDYLVNRVTYTRDGGSAQTAEDLSSQSRYGIRAVSESGLLNATDADVLELAEARLARASQPQRNVESLSVMLDRLTADEAAVVCQLTVGDQVKVDVDVPGSQNALTSTVRIEEVRHDATPQSHRVSYRLTTLSDEFAGRVDGGTAATVSFVDTWDGGTAATVSFTRALDGGSAIFG